MPWTVIAATGDASQLELLLEAGAEILKVLDQPASTRPRIAISVEDAKRLQEAADPSTTLLIVAASLPQQQSSPDTVSFPGLEFVKVLQALADAPACILVSESERTAHYRAVLGMTRCLWLPVDAATNYIEQCVELARKLSRDAGASSLPAAAETNDAAHPRQRQSAAAATETSAQRRCPAKPYAVMEFQLSPRFLTPQFKIFDVQNPSGRPIADASPFALEPNDVAAIVRDSRLLKARVSEALNDGKKWSEYRPRWQGEYKALGGRVASLLWTEEVKQSYWFAQGKVDGNIRVRFSLDREVYDGLWESMLNSDREFLMLNTTMTRRAQRNRPHDGLSDRLASDDGVLNVLVVKSDVRRMSDVEEPDDDLWKAYASNLTLRPLEHLDDEAKALLDLHGDGRKGKRKAKAAAPADGGGSPAPRISVEVLEPPRAKAGWSLAQALEQRLRQEPQRYDVIHFAGHALFASSESTEDARGYLLFSGYPKAQAVPTAEVASWLKDTSVQLVYLSCCRSSAARAAIEFAANDVPMTIGFTWDLDDRRAVDFASLFYRELLTTDLKVCPAFRAARQKLYRRFEQSDPIWASPILIAQPMDWTAVEGALCPPQRGAHPAPRAVPQDRPAQPAK